MGVEEGFGEIVAVGVAEGVGDGVGLECGHNSGWVLHASTISHLIAANLAARPSSFFVFARQLSRQNWLAILQISV